MKTLREMPWKFLILLFFSLAYSPSLRANGYNKIAKTIAKKCANLENKKIAIVGFAYVDDRTSPGSTIVSERLTTLIANNHDIEIVERQLLNKVLEELKLQAAGILDVNSANQLGKILNVSAIVTGTLMDLSKNEVEINARLIDVSNGSIRGVARTKVKKEWEDSPASETTAKEGKTVSESSIVTVQPISKSEIAVSDKLFDARCVICHGPNGQGKTISSNPQDIKGNLTSQETLSKKDWELVTHISEGGEHMPRYGGLPGFSNKLTDEQLLNLVHFIRALGLAAVSKSNKSQEFSALKSGSAIYQTNCSICHGIDAKGSALMAKTLNVTQSAMNLTDEKFMNMTDEQLADIINNGKGTMPAQKTKFSPNGIPDLLRYIHCLKTKS